MSEIRLRLISYTSGLDPCGVASYQRHLTAALREFADITTVRLSAERTLGADLPALRKRRADIVAAANMSQGFDGALIDFTDTFFNGSRPGEALFPLFLRNLNCPAVVLLHELPGRTDNPEVLGGPTSKLVQRLTHLAFARRDSGGRSWAGFVNEAYFRQADHLATHAEALIQARTSDLPPERLHLLPTPAYPLPWPAAERHDLDVKYGLVGKRVCALFGFPQPSKGFDRAVAALPYLPEDVVVLQIGDAPRCADEVAKLTAQAAELGVGGRFLRSGAVDDESLAILLHRADLGLVPFRHVHQSSSVGHMIGAGLPIVAHRIAALEAIRRDGGGILFAADHPRVLAAAILNLLEDDEKRQEFALRNAEYTAKYSFRGVALYLLHLFGRSFQP